MTFDYYADVQFDEENNAYRIDFVDLDGCLTFADDIQSINFAAEDALKTWLKVSKKLMIEIPDASTMERLIDKGYDKDHLIEIRVEI